MNSSYNSSINYEEWVKQDHSFNLRFNMDVDEILNLSHQNDIISLLSDSLPNVRFVLFKTLVEDYLPKINRDFSGGEAPIAPWGVDTKNHSHNKASWAVDEQDTWEVFLNHESNIAFNVSTDRAVNSSEAFALSYGSIANSIIDSVTHALSSKYDWAEVTNYKSNWNIDNWKVLSYESEYVPEKLTWYDDEWTLDSDYIELESHDDDDDFEEDEQLKETIH